MEMMQKRSFQVARGKRGLRQRGRERENRASAVDGDDYVRCLEREGALVVVMVVSAGEKNVIRACIWGGWERGRRKGKLVRLGARGS